jgi:hypothetical protein
VRRSRSWCEISFGVHGSRAVSDDRYLLRRCAGRRLYTVPFVLKPGAAKLGGHEWRRGLFEACAEDAWEDRAHSGDTRNISDIPRAREAVLSARGSAVLYARIVLGEDGDWTGIGLDENAGACFIHLESPRVTLSKVYFLRCCVRMLLVLMEGRRSDPPLAKTLLAVSLQYFATIVSPTSPIHVSSSSSLDPSMTTDRASGSYDTVCGRTWAGLTLRLFEWWGPHSVELTTNQVCYAL